MLPFATARMHSRWPRRKCTTRMWSQHCCKRAERAYWTGANCSTRQPTVSVLSPISSEQSKSGPDAAIVNSLAVGMLSAWRRGAAAGQGLIPIIQMVVSTLNEQPANQDVKWLRWTLAVLYLEEHRSTGAIPLLNEAADLIGAAMHEWVNAPLPIELTLAACQIYFTVFGLTRETAYIDQAMTTVERSLANPEIPNQKRYSAEMALAECHLQRFEAWRDQKNAEQTITGFRDLLDRNVASGLRNTNVISALALLLAQQSISTGNADLLAEARTLAHQVAKLPSDIAVLSEPNRNRIAAVLCTAAETRNCPGRC